MLDSCKLISYSPNNIYASDYYFGCNKFDKIRNEVIAYEHRTDDRESPKYKKMMEEFDYWNNKVPELSYIAGEYEEKLEMKNQEKMQAREEDSGASGSKSKIDYFA